MSECERDFFPFKGKKNRNQHPSGAFLLFLVIFVRASASFPLPQIKAPQGTPSIFGRFIELGMRRRRDLLFLWIIEEPSQPIILAGASKIDAFNGFVFSDITFTVNQLPHVAAENSVA